MIIDGYQKEDMFKDLLKDLNKDLNSIQIPTPVDINESSTKQIVYKIDGNFNGNIKGDNVTVIIMGDGNINGNIESENGEVVLIKGDINGDVKADKVVCPTPPIKKTCELCRYYVNGGVNHYWCTQGDIIRRCIKCEHYEDKISDNIAAPYSKTKKEEPEISNYMSIRPINIKCPNCHQFINKNLRIDASVVNDKIFHTMIAPLDNDY